jgi:CGNR zinc finger/Putative stress-induced transcription regulator
LCGDRRQVIAQAIITTKPHMTGEKPKIGNSLLPEPGGRQPAPHDLAVVQAFMNTYCDRAKHGGEILLRPDVLHEWLSTHQLIADRHRLSVDDLQRAIAIRGGMRALAFANNGLDLDLDAVIAMRQASAGALSEIHIDPDGPRLISSPDADINRALGALLAITARAMNDGTWSRLKACPGRDCGWAFYDHSRNQSARWCSMKICGDREKARAHYQRKIAERPYASKDG